MSPTSPGRDLRLMRIGAISALAWVAIQVIGNLLHPRLPGEAVGALEQIAASGVWQLAHIILLTDYVILIPMLVGIAASFSGEPWGVRLGVPLIVVAVSVGIVQVAIHPTALAVLAEAYVAAPDAATQADVVRLYDGFWAYNIALEVGHLLLIHVIVILIASAMLREPLYAKWVAWLGIAGGTVAAVSLLVGEVILESSVLGDAITFGVGLLPSAVWLVVVAVVLLRYRPPAAPGAAGGGGGG